MTPRRQQDDVGPIFGCGKTHLAVALATLVSLAVKAGYRGYFTSGANMCANIAIGARLLLTVTEAPS